MAYCGSCHAIDFHPGALRGASPPSDPAVHGVQGPRTHAMATYARHLFQNRVGDRHEFDGGRKKALEAWGCLRKDTVRKFRDLPIGHHGRGCQPRRLDQATTSWTKGHLLLLDPRNMYLAKRQGLSSFTTLAYIPRRIRGRRTPGDTSAVARHRDERHLCTVNGSTRARCLRMQYVLRYCAVRCGTWTWGRGARRNGLDNRGAGACTRVNHETLLYDLGSGAL
ncbi:hypothetical protein F5Y15DRAFT_176135 [Xylariaceae sp. FL0016]|nr:hypothetical protein F5Y15DRAFT_176135 [Xylariaceae sp. FL0016]